MRLHECVAAFVHLGRTQGSNAASGMDKPKRPAALPHPIGWGEDRGEGELWFQPAMCTTDKLKYLVFCGAFIPPQRGPCPGYNTGSGRNCYRSRALVVPDR